MPDERAERENSLDWIKTCREIAGEAASELMRIYHSEERSVELSVGHGGDRTLVADQASEDIVVRKLRQTGLDLALISEEMGEIRMGKMPQYTVVLDPLDGSFNFKIGLGYFAVSMAVLNKADEVVAAYVLDVPRATEYYAAQDGAFRNGRRIRTTKKKNADRILIECSKGIEPEVIDVLGRALLRARHVRAPGALALDLCRVADGTFECLLCANASRYLDVAAGIHIVEKAGGLVSDFHGRDRICEGTVLKAGNLIAAANRSIHESILEDV
jgi:myo-inositol-1(or 4)-monophosphatase